jgi:DNA-binding transcriptional LysR family regulator
MDFLTRIQTFVRIADAGSISAAARDLSISVPMASRHLRSLEDELGVELVRRSTRELRITPAGAEFLERSRQLLQDVDEARESVRPGGSVRGSLTVSVPVSLGVGYVSHLIPPLLAQHPELRLTLRFDDHMVELLADNIDVAIRAGVSPPNSTEVVARQMLSFERVLCASPEFVGRHPDLVSPDQLEALPCLVQGSSAARWRLQSPNGVAEVLVDGPLRSVNVLALRDAALAGLGVARLPIRFVAEDLREGRLVRVLDRVQPTPGVLWGLYHRRARGSASIRVLLDHLTAGLSSQLASTMASLR